MFLCSDSGHRRRLFEARRRARAIAVVAACWLMVGQSASVGADISQEQEYRAKASFLSNFPSFVEWPDEAFSSPQSPLSVCVYGSYSFGLSLAESVGGKTVHGRRMEVKRTRAENDLRACHILFVSHSEEKHYAAVLHAIQGASVLTVGETPGFLAAGGAVNFLLQQDALQFEVNLDSASVAHLKISANMLALARRVVGKTVEAK